MEVKEIFDKILSARYQIIEDVELKLVLENSELIRIENTHLSDFIRLLMFNENLFVQEITLKNEIMIRKINSMKDADFFIQKRLDFYERKWDGCGCKIDYYE